MLIYLDKGSILLASKLFFLNLCSWSLAFLYGHTGVIYSFHFVFQNTKVICLATACVGHITEHFNVFMITLVTMERFVAVTFPFLSFKFYGGISSSDRQRRYIRVSRFDVFQVLLLNVTHLWSRERDPLHTLYYLLVYSI